MRGRTQNYVDFSGGLNSQAAPFVIEPTQVRDALNVHTTPQGSVRKRNGFENFATPSMALHSLAAANDVTKWLIGVGPINGTDSIVKITTGGTVSNLKTGVAKNTRWEWAQAAVSGAVGPMYGLNGVDTPQRWDASAASSSDWVATTGTVPNGTMIRYHGSRIWIAGVSSAPSRLFFSGITGTAPDPLNWDANNFVNFEPRDGEAITALGTVGPYLLVFKPRKTFVVYDIVTGANRKLSDEIGCIAPRSVVETPEGTFFLNETEGVLSTDGTKIRRVSDNVINTLTDAGTSQATLSKAAATYHNRSYVLSYSAGLTNNDHTLEYHLPTQSWWKHDCASNQFALIDPIGQPILYSAHPTLTKVQKAFAPNVFQDGGVNYTGGSYFTTAYFIWGEPAMMKRLREVRVEGIGSWDAQSAIDFNDIFSSMDGELWDNTVDTGGTFGGDGFFGGTGTFAPAMSATASYRYYTPGRARAFSFKFLNNDSNDFEVFALTAAIDGVKD